MTNHLLGRDRAELEALAAALGQPAYRGRQLAHWLYAVGATRFDAMTDLPAAFRQRLAAEFEIGAAAIVARQGSADGAVKLLLELADGARVETVALPWPDRLSVCVSSQTGCAIGCTFCATASLGAGRDLSPGEIAGQPLAARAELGRAPTHVVLMGMGEPLANLDNVLAAVRLWRDELTLSPRRVTISTVGLPPAMARLAEAELPLTLAVSLHSADDELRAQLVPTAGRRYSVAQVLAAAREYGSRSGRRLTYEIALLAGVNDRPQDAELLARRLTRGEHVNLIPYNPVGTAPYARPRPEAVGRFRAILEAAGLAVTQRQARGDDIAGACGQLRAATA
jgi:23S rRNA (adenine2503-C2)-methyltransferase